MAKYFSNEGEQVSLEQAYEILAVVGGEIRVHSNSSSPSEPNGESYVAVVQDNRDHLPWSIERRDPDQSEPMPLDGIPDMVLALNFAKNYVDHFDMSLF